MKLSVSRSELATAFQIVGGAVPSRTTKDILRNAKLSVKDGIATLMGTDQEVGIRYQLPEVQTDSVGEVLLPPQRMVAILREAQDDTIHIEVTDDSLWVRSGQSEFQLSVENPAEFSDVPEFQESDYYVLQGRALKLGVQRTIFATDPESLRYALGGIKLELSHENVTLAATDSRRLAVYKTSCGAHGSVSEEVGEPVIPSKAMTLIDRSIHEDDQEVRIAVHQNDVLIQSGLSTIFARLVEGRFPRYQDVMPTEFGISIELVVGPFYSAVRQAMIVMNEESHGVDFSFSEGTLTLTSRGAAVGSSKIELPIGYDGDDFMVTFDPKYVADFLKVLDPVSPLSLNLVDPNSAVVFRSGDNYTYVVMPLSNDDRN
ncbi:MAG: DNA polymerase III subunit beta [Planctomycetaceae bacterium]|nr:DNA polymerase III subunit beta [Planctomycetaceae bacterium]MCA9044048.1 DNA polymerase III subunit beta [Planctomycetaceae bacterium]